MRAGNGKRLGLLAEYLREPAPISTQGEDGVSFLAELEEASLSLLQL